MRYIGTIQLTQIQRDRMKVGEKPNQSYQLESLMIVDALRLSADGVIGITGDGGEMIDVHHAGHPNTRNSDNKNSISIGLTSSYRHMRERFGAIAKVGVAGENIIIDDGEHLNIVSMTEGTSLIIKSDVSGSTTRLVVGKGIPPCRPFTRYLTQNPTLDGDELETHLQFLSDGMRGFYVFLENPTSTPVIQAGDAVYIQD